MTEDVKPRRRYESPRRQEQAAQTRRDILAAAGTLFRAARLCRDVDAADRGRGRRRRRDRLPGVREQGGPLPRGRRVRAGRWPDPRRRPRRGAAGNPGRDRGAGSTTPGGAVRGDATGDPPPGRPAPAGAARRSRDRQGTAEAVGRDGGVAARGPGTNGRDAGRAGRAAARPRRSKPHGTSSGHCARSRSTTCSSSSGAGRTSTTRPGWPPPSSASCSPTPRVGLARARRSPSRRAAPARGRRGRSGPDRAWPRARSCPRSG